MNVTAVAGALVRARRAAALLAGAASACAHARISPPVALAKSGQLYSLAVPTEKEGETTTKIVAHGAGGLLDRLVRPAPGWKRDVQQTGSGESAVIQKVTWTGGAGADRKRTRSSSSSPRPRRAATYTFQVRADLLRRLDRRLVGA